MIEFFVFCLYGFCVCVCVCCPRGQTSQICLWFLLTVTHLGSLLVSPVVPVWFWPWDPSHSQCHHHHRTLQKPLLLFWDTLLSLAAAKWYLECGWVLSHPFSSQSGIVSLQGLPAPPDDVLLLHLILSADPLFSLGVCLYSRAFVFMSMASFCQLDLFSKDVLTEMPFSVLYSRAPISQKPSSLLLYPLIFHESQLQFFSG